MADKEAKLPMYARYKTLLYKYVPKTHRTLVNTAISLMPNDPDGVWSEINDHGDYRYSIDLDEAIDLCRAYELALREANEQRKGEAVA